MSDLSISVVFSFFTKANDTRQSPFSTRNFAVSLNPSNIAREQLVQLTYRSGASAAAQHHAAAQQQVFHHVVCTIRLRKLHVFESPSAEANCAQWRRRV